MKVARSRQALFLTLAIAAVIAAALTAYVSRANTDAPAAAVQQPSGMSIPF